MILFNNFIWNSRDVNIVQIANGSFVVGNKVTVVVSGWILEDRPSQITFNEDMLKWHSVFGCEYSMFRGAFRPWHSQLTTLM